MKGPIRATMRADLRASMPKRRPRHIEKHPWRMDRIDELIQKVSIMWRGGYIL